MKTTCRKHTDLCNNYSGKSDERNNNNTEIFFTVKSVYTAESA